MRTDLAEPASQLRSRPPLALLAGWPRTSSLLLLHMLEMTV